MQFLNFKRKLLNDESIFALLKLSLHEQQIFCFSCVVRIWVDPNEKKEFQEKFSEGNNGLTLKR